MPLAPTYTTQTRKSDDPAAGEAAGDDAPSLVQQVEAEFAPKFEELSESMKSLAEQAEQAAESDDAEAVAEAKKSLEEADERVKALTAERDRALLPAQIESFRNTEKSLKDFMQAQREGHGAFPGTTPSAEEQSVVYGPDSDNSFFIDAQKALKTDSGPEWERWAEAMVQTEKAMTQASGSTGGYLVPPEVSNQILTFREQGNILRPLMSRIQVDSDVFRFAAQTGGLLAGWVAELAEKPESELSFGEVSTNVFWKAGMAVVSNQLLRNSNPTIDRLIYRDLGRRLAALEEIAFISGTGEGQPLGILRTPGVLHNGVGNDYGLPANFATTVDALLDAIIDGITSIYTHYFGAPNAIIMHPRTWALIVKERKDEAAATFMVGPPASNQGGGRDATDPLPGYGSGPNPTGSLFGLPVYTTRNMPTNAGADDNESRVIIGNFQEGLILDHAGVTLDSSEHVYFRTNQTIFRAEDAVGFTAGRYPKGFCVLGGTGLANR